jgi:hypothetical protein
LDTLARALGARTHNRSMIAFVAQPRTNYGNNNGARQARFEAEAPDAARRTRFGALVRAAGLVTWLVT